MEILETKILKGPNIWSIEKPQLVVLKIINPKSETTSNVALEELAIKIDQLLSSVHENGSNHSDFLQRIQTQELSIAYMIACLALELQRGSDPTLDFVNSYIKGADISYAIFSYSIESAGIFAANCAVKIVECLMSGKLYKAFKKDLKDIKEIFINQGLGPSTQSIVDEASIRGIPYRRMGAQSLIMFGYGKNLKLINASATSDTSIIGVDMASEKDFTKKILAEAYIPVPHGVVVRNLNELKQALDNILFPIVIKPLDGNHGNGVTTHIYDKEKAYLAYKIAKKISSSIIVEHFINGFDYRFLMVNYKLVAAAKRKPASVMGDGVSTIQELIEKVNQDPKRGNDHENFLTKINIDETTTELLITHGLTLQTVLENGKEFFLKYSANISAGGTAIDVTDQVHVDNHLIAERVARLLNLNICGIDLISTDISIPLSEATGAIIEVNASPGLRMHLKPTEGKSRNIGKAIINLLYPQDVKARIPIIAVTGTNGKTTTTRLIAHFAAHEGYQVGFTTTDGIYINNRLIYQGDCSGPKSAESVLREPIVDFAVFECARGGILHSGLGFDKCNISIVINISADHLGLDEVLTLEDLVKVKSVVPKSTTREGYAILNADDDLVFSMRDDLYCNIALFSMKSNNPRIKEHCSKGGIAAYVKEDNIIISAGEINAVFANVKDIPLTFHGAATAMTQNILAAILAAKVSNFNMAHIVRLLKNFFPSPENIPGRMNLFDFTTFKVLVDYGHNMGAFLELKKYLSSIKCNQKIGIFGAPGDRRNEDIINLGFYAAQIFDKIIIKHDSYGRGRTNQEITRLIEEGVHKCNPNFNIEVISDETKALQFTMEHAKSGDFIAYFPEDVNATIEFLNQYNQRIISDFP